MVRKFAILAAVVVSTAIGALAPAQAASWLEKSIYLTGPRYDGDLPACEAGLRTIASRFSQKGPVLELGPRDPRFRTGARDAYRPQPPAHPAPLLAAVALVSDGKKHR